MLNLTQYLFANAYTGISPALNTASAICTVNGQPTDCGPISAALGIGSGLSLLLFFAFFILIIASLWKIFKKAGQPGWTSIVPIYNIVVMLHIIKKPTWWVILTFIPLVNIIVSIIIVYNLSKVFGKGAGFTIGMIVFPFIFYPILGFGKATYILPVSRVDEGMGVPPASTQTI
jgi:hypothetical protein